jgi:hypothetical protein
MNYTGKPITELRKLTKRQILDAVVAALDTPSTTKRALLAFLMDGETLPDAPKTKHRADGQIQEREDALRDVETDAVTQRTVTTWSYYEDEPRRPVNEIITTVYDGAGAVVSKRTVKHFPDGRQPIAVEG